MSRKRVAYAAATVLLLALLAYLGRGYMEPLIQKARGRRTVADALRRYGLRAEKRLTAHFAQADVAYPPQALTLIAFKHERALEVWAQQDTAWHFVHAYPILSASGKPGPKLREGDLQVPEGFYRIEGLNPNSSYHLSMKLDYPNTFDRQMAKQDGRTNLGGDIFIHGKEVSIGCIAIGDEAIEELFVLVAKMGKDNVTVLTAPNDLRQGPAITQSANTPSWLPGLYAELGKALREFAHTPQPSAAE